MFLNNPSPPFLQGSLKEMRLLCIRDMPIPRTSARAGCQDDALSHAVITELKEITSERIAIAPLCLGHFAHFLTFLLLAPKGYQCPYSLAMRLSKALVAALQTQHPSSPSTPQQSTHIESWKLTEIETRGLRIERDVAHTILSELKTELREIVFGLT